MDIKTALSEEHSKFQTDLIATYIGKNRKRFDELMTLVLDHGEESQTIASRAAWVMRECTERHPDLITQHLEKIVEKLRKGEFNTAVKRQCTGILQSIPCPPALLGPIYDSCYRLLGDPGEAIAVRVNAMTTVANICESEPELSDEVSLLIKEHLPFASPAFKARAKRELKRLEEFSLRQD